MLNPNTIGNNVIANANSPNGLQKAIQVKAQANETVIKVQQQPENNRMGIFLTHEQKIQATYNFQHLFRKKSQLYNIHKKNKKVMGKNKDREAATADDNDKECKNVKKGHWNQQQNRKYHWFLQLNNKKFIYKHLRRCDKIFKAMSTFIGTREAEQCRSHHQKMQKKFKHFYQIILRLRMQYYGTCKTQAVKADLEENGYIKESKELLIEENIMKEMENTKDLEHNSVKDENEDEENGFVLPMHDKNGNDSEMSSEQFQCKKQEGEVHMLLGQNYQQELNYKIY